MMHEYLELQIDVNPLYGELVAEILTADNIKEIILSEEYFGKDYNLVRNTTIKAYIPVIEGYQERLNQIEEKLKTHFSDLKNMGIHENNLGSWEIKYKTVKNEDWEENWKKYWHPQRIGKLITICPGWENYTPEVPDEIIIRLDPGAAFGTGTHPTTRLCLRALEEIFIEDKTPKTVIDVGTGSGILAIAACKLGATSVTGTDIDPVAIDIARENAEVNDCKDICQFVTTPLKSIQVQYDIVVVNILAKTIIALSRDINKVCKRGGRLILSGIIEEKSTIIENHFEEIGFTIDKPAREDGWYSVVAKRV